MFDTVNIADIELLGICFSFSWHATTKLKVQSIDFCIKHDVKVMSMCIDCIYFNTRNAMQRKWHFHSVENIC